MNLNVSQPVLNRSRSNIQQPSMNSIDNTTNTPHLKKSLIKRTYEFIKTLFNSLCQFGKAKQTSPTQDTFNNPAAIHNAPPTAVTSTTTNHSKTIFDQTNSSIKEFLTHSELITQSPTLTTLQSNYLAIIQSNDSSIENKTAQLTKILDQFKTHFKTQSSIVIKQSIVELKQTLQKNLKTYVTKGELKFQSNLASLQQQMLQRNHNIKATKPKILSQLKKTLPNQSQEDITTLYNNVVNLYLEQEFGKAFTFTQGDAFTHWQGRCSEQINQALNQLLPTQELKNIFNQTMPTLLNGLNQTIKTETTNLIQASFTNTAAMANIKTIITVAQGLEASLNDTPNPTTKQLQELYTMTQNSTHFSEGFITGFKTDTQLTPDNVQAIVTSEIQGKTTDLTAEEQHTFTQLMTTHILQRYAHKGIIQSATTKLHSTSPKKMASFTLISKSTDTKQQWEKLFTKKNFLGYVTQTGEFHQDFKTIAKTIETELKKQSNLSPSHIKTIVLNAMDTHHIPQNPAFTNEVTNYITQRLEHKKAISTEQTNVILSDKVTFGLESKKQDFKTSELQTNPKMKALFNSIKDSLQVKLKTKTQVAMHSKGQLSDIQQTTKHTKLSTTQKTTANVAYKTKKWINQFKITTKKEAFKNVAKQATNQAKDYAIEEATQKTLQEAENSNSLQKKYEESLQHDISLAETLVQSIGENTEQLTATQQQLSTILQSNSADTPKELTTLATKLQQQTQKLDKVFKPLAKAAGKSLDVFIDQVPFAGELYSTAKAVSYLASVAHESHKIATLKTGLEQVTDLNRYLTTADLNNPQNQQHIQQRLDKFEQLLEHIDIKDSATKNALFSTLNVVTGMSGVKIGNLFSSINKTFGYDKLSKDDYKTIAQNIMVIQSSYSNLASTDKSSSVTKLLTVLKEKKGTTTDQFYKFAQAVNETSSHIIDTNDIKSNI